MKILHQFKNSSKIFEDCKLFECLRRYADFQREMVNFCHLEMSLCPSLEQNLMDEKQNFFDGNYSYIFSSNVHIFWNLLKNFFQKNVNFSQKSSESSASNLRSFEDSLTSGNGPKMKTKMDLWTKIFED